MVELEELEELEELVLEEVVLELEEESLEAGCEEVTVVEVTVVEAGDVEVWALVVCEDELVDVLEAVAERERVELVEEATAVGWEVCPPAGLPPGLWGSFGGRAASAAGVSCQLRPAAVSPPPVSTDSAARRIQRRDALTADPSSRRQERTERSGSGKQLPAVSPDDAWMQPTTRL